MFACECVPSRGKHSVKRRALLSNQHLRLRRTSREHTDARDPAQRLSHADGVDVPRTDDAEPLREKPGKVPHLPFVRRVPLPAEQDGELRGGHGF